MKADTLVVIAKAGCYVIIGFCSPLVSGLGQWANEGVWPPAINWVCILAGGAVGAATQLLAFFSKSYSDYSKRSETPTPTPTNVSI